MTPPVRSRLFDEFRAAWPNRPYPLLVDHRDAPEGRICPAASLYALGKVHADRFDGLGVRAGEVAACFPSTWMEWAGMLQGCLRKAVTFAPLAPGSTMARQAWCEAVDASLVVDAASAVRRADGRRLSPVSLVLGPPAVALAEEEILAITQPRVVDPFLEPERPIWMDHRLAPLAEALAVLTLLRAGAELHLGVTLAQAVAMAEDDHRLFGGTGASSSMAAVRGWARTAV